MTAVSTRGRAPDVASMSRRLNSNRVWSLRAVRSFVPINWRAWTKCAESGQKNSSPGRPSRSFSALLQLARASGFLPLLLKHLDDLGHRGRILRPLVRATKRNDAWEPQGIPGGVSGAGRDLICENLDHHLRLQPHIRHQR